MDRIIADCVIVGGGAAGMMAAGTAAEIHSNMHFVLLEKNLFPGRKILITGKGRCNVTNNCDLDNLLKNVVTNSRFLFSAFSSFMPSDTIDFFESLGVPLKTERGNRVFPVSDHSYDIVDALKRYCNKNNISHLHGEIETVCVENGKVSKCILSDGTEIKCGSVIIATGGMSFPGTGSTGDGYRIASALGHTIIPLKPSLVPLDVEESAICSDLEGLSLKNTRITLKRNGKKVFSDFGELVFTSSGLSGPIILSASAHCLKGDLIILDLKPAIDEHTLDLRLISDFEKYANKNFSNALDDLLPKKLIPVIVNLSGISPYKKVNSVTKSERNDLCRLLKELTFTVKNLRPISEAIVTSGGVSVKEINPKTMESKLVENLYFAGEVIDCDAYTGGFNLQIAFSTGRLAGLSVAKKGYNDAGER